MGFFGFIASVGSAIGSALSSAATAVGNAISTVGKAIVETGKEFLKTTIETLKLVVDVLEFVAKKLGIIEDETSEDLGDRALRSDRTRDDFDNVNECIDYLKENVEPTPLKELEKLSPEERLKRVAIGNALLAKAIEEKMSLEIPVDFWKEAVERGLSAEEIDNLLKKFKDAGVAPIDFVKYLKRELDEEKEENMDDLLIDLYTKEYPQIEHKEIEKKVILLKDI